MATLTTGTKNMKRSFTLALFLAVITRRREVF